LKTAYWTKSEGEDKGKGKVKGKDKDKGRGKGEFYRRQDHEGPEREER
jgi:hypothetical protein